MLGQVAAAEMMLRCGKRTACPLTLIRGGRRRSRRVQLCCSTSMCGSFDSMCDRLRVGWVLASQLVVKSNFLNMLKVLNADVCTLCCLRLKCDSVVELLCDKTMLQHTMRSQKRTRPIVDHVEHMKSVSP